MNSTQSTPAVAVIMPVYNARAFVAEAIESILQQTFTDLEFVIVDDGSTDGSGSIIASFEDPRIRHITIENRGIAGALNEGIRQSTAPLIARMDADDVSLPERLATQVAYLQKHPQIGLVGTSATIINTDGTVRGTLKHPTTNAQLQFALMFHTPFAHPTVMFRREVLERSGLYDTRPEILEDLELWSRMARVTQLANIPQELIRYRAVPTSFSHTTKDMEWRVVQQRRVNWKALVPTISERELDLLGHIGFRHSRVKLKELLGLRKHLCSLVDRWATGSQDRSALTKKVHAYLMSFHVIGHGNIVQKVMDRLVKRIALTLPLS